ncbi:hypothetical protein HanIR_Chr04g0180361 [Helianthus annuus]|nr:hypothetical protein HanIR_Chr04g0180361 [Helianthus annuus]
MYTIFQRTERRASYLCHNPFFTCASCTPIASGSKKLNDLQLRPSGAHSKYRFQTDKIGTRFRFRFKIRNMHF